MNVLESYLISLGFSVNKGELRKFELAIKDAGVFVEKTTGGIVGQVAKWQTAITSGFAAIATGVIAFGDHVAEQDQRFRLFGLRMFMTQESAKKLKIGLDALGASLEEVAWDPELHARFMQLVADQTKLQEQLGTGFEEEMRGIRDLRFEVTRLQVALQYLGMKVVADIFESFGFSIGDVMGRLRNFNDWIEEHIPQISGVIGDTLVPILKDAWAVLKHIAEAMEVAAVAFTNLTGLLLGDSSIEGTTFKIDNLGQALKDISKFARYFMDVFTYAFEEVMHLVSAATLFIAGKTTEASQEFRAAMATDKQGLARLLAGKSGDEKDLGRGTGGVPTGPLVPQVVAAARQFGIDPRIALGVANVESRVRETDASGRVITSPAGALGVMQLMPDTAKDLGVNPLDARQNIQGGVKYLAQLFAKYHDWRLALAAYNAGPGAVDKALKKPDWLGSLPSETQKYVNDVMATVRRANVGNEIQQNVSAQMPQQPPSMFSSDDFVRGMAASAHGAAGAQGVPEGSGAISQDVTIGPVNVTVAQTNANPREIGEEVQHSIAHALRSQTQRDLAQLSPAY